MDIHSFVNQGSNIQQKKSVTCFKGHEYPLFFLSRLLAHLVPEGVERLDLVNLDFSTIIAQLSMLFLGTKRTFWLGSFDELDADQKTRLLGYLSKYKGPNHIYFFMHKDIAISDADFCIVDLPIRVDTTFIPLASKLFGQSLKNNGKRWFERILTSKVSLSLDLACMMFHYALFSGSEIGDDMHTWVSQLIVPDESLFALSDAFFSRNTQGFWQCWSKINSSYPVQFWITFWSEQLFKAYNYLVLMQAQRIADAKQISARLPFSFSQRQWKLYTSHELRLAHDIIARLDFDFKNGRNEIGLDLFYIKFFSGAYKNTASIS